METIKNAVVRFVRDEEGAGVIEYSLIAGIMAAIIIAALYTGVGGAIKTVFAKIEGELTKVANYQG
ncbi:Flp family type IVb pilin [Acidithiobacillus sp. M4-SHS-6]|uniref:Flp family type IVb pilin n=1 Tax=Acidithiobacillus sp. M4-SHS-6 TaxID=3383024 RepID=UPI0039BDF96A